MKSNVTIKKKLITVSILILTIPLIVLGFLSYQKSNNSLDKLGETNLKNSVEQTVDLINVLNDQVEEGKLSLEEAQEEVKIAILGERGEDGTRPINNNVDLGKYGYIFIADSEGNLVAHPTIEGENTYNNTDANGKKYAQEYLQTGLNGGGYSYYTYPLPDNEDKIEDKVTYSKAFPEWDWVVVAGTYMSDFNAPANDILTINLIVGGVALLVGIFVIWSFANSISKPIKLVADRMNQLADKDLSHDALVIESKDETGLLANAMNRMQTELRNMLNNISNTSGVVASSSEELSESANEVKTGTEQISATMQELASGTDSQANSASDLASAMNSFTEKVRDANKKGEIVGENSKNVLNMTDEGSKLMEKSVQQMTKINEIVQDAVVKMQNLDKQSQQISNIVTVINEIAEQTNLLALNAAIEAARAGEHGKGFAVVANEVGKLADQVSASITEVTDIVKVIQNDSNGVTKSLKNGYEEVEQGTSQIKTTGQTFENIKEAISEVVNHITQVTTNLSEMTESTQQMNSAIEDIASISEESAAGVEQTSASTQQTNSSMEEIAGSSEKLSKTADELNELVRGFKL